VRVGHAHWEGYSMKGQHIWFGAASVSILAVALAGAASATDNRFGIKNRLVAALSPAQEVPSVSSPNAKGTFKAVIDEANQTISYELTYQGLEAEVTQAHIHVGQSAVNGGVSFFLCGNAPTVPPAVFPQPPACPASPATVTGVITAEHIVGPAGQGVATSLTANEFSEVVALLREGLTYANVHTVKFPAGEIRGQVRIGIIARD
jgi:hypothetical protein